MLFFLLLGLSIFVAWRWFVAYSSLNPLALPNWHWADHPNTLLITYRDARCGCSRGLHDIVAAQTAQQRDVVLISTPANDARKEVLDLVKHPKLHLMSLNNSDTKLLNELSSNGKTTVLRIVSGRIKYRVSGLSFPAEVLE